MCLVHHKKCRGHSCDPRHGFLLGQLLGRQEKESGPAGLDFLPRILHFRVGVRGINGDGGALAECLGETGDLVLLEGDQR